MQQRLQNTKDQEVDSHIDHVNIATTEDDKLF